MLPREARSRSGSNLRSGFRAKRSSDRHYKAQTAGQSQHEKQSLYRSHSSRPAGGQIHPQEDPQ